MIVSIQTYMHNSHSNVFHSLKLLPSAILWSFLRLYSVVKIVPTDYRPKVNHFRPLTLKLCGGSIFGPEKCLKKFIFTCCTLQMRFWSSVESGPKLRIRTIWKWIKIAICRAIWIKSAILERKRLFFSPYMITCLNAILIHF